MWVLNIGNISLGEPVTISSIPTTKKKKFLQKIKFLHRLLKVSECMFWIALQSGDDRHCTNLTLIYTIMINIGVWLGYASQPSPKLCTFLELNDELFCAAITLALVTGRECQFNGKYSRGFDTLRAAKWFYAIIHHANPVSLLSRRQGGVLLDFTVFEHHNDKW